GQTDYAVGISLGIERLILLIKERSKEKTKTKVLVCAIDEKLYSDVLKIAEKIRKKSINTETDLNNRKIGKQIEYANSLGIPYVLILGEKEQKENKITLRDMKTGKEELLTVENAIEKID
ncbi:MAG: His/Gly/Thr/Pro-type tRNA ligase C-terminal domain-containing protein, partial [Candidatus ainarchaeum sp.]|nr:His/Gly/Thr/Pro-type tRNA ligase C-terminal domain-containing protein [Candidatus ainarchaeum sp.]